jgi:hypothetical protein
VVSLFPKFHHSHVLLSFGGSPQAHVINHRVQQVGAAGRGGDVIQITIRPQADNLKHQTKPVCTAPKLFKCRLRSNRTRKVRFTRQRCRRFSAGDEKRHGSKEQRNQRWVVHDITADDDINISGTTNCVRYAFPCPFKFLRCAPIQQEGLNMATTATVRVSICKDSQGTQGTPPCNGTRTARRT